MKTSVRTKTICLLITLVAVFACTLSLGCASATAPAGSADRGFSASDRAVIAYYYIWFTKGWFNNTEGNAGNALADVHPILGTYDSNNPTVIEEHIKMAKRAKIDAFAVSWWIDRPESDKRVDILDLVFQKAAAHNFKVTIDLEADGMPVEAITRCLRYYLSHYSHHMEICPPSTGGPGRWWTTTTRPTQIDLPAGTPRSCPASTKERSLAGRKAPAAQAGRTATMAGATE